MAAYDDPLLQGGSAHAGGPGTSGTYTFHGTAVDVYGIRGPSVTIDGQIHPLGTVAVLVDGRTVGLATLESPGYSYHVLICHAGNLGAGNHVVEIQSQDGWAVVDYIEAIDTSPTQPAPGAYAGERAQQNGSTAVASGGTGAAASQPGSAPGAASASAPPAALTTGSYVIYPGNAPARCVETAGLTDQSQIDIYSPGPDRHDVWRITALGQQRYRISPADAPNEALTVARAGPLNAGVATVALYAYMGDPAQQWIIQPAFGPYFHVYVMGQTTAVLGVNAHGSANGTLLVGFPPNDPAAALDTGRQFDFEPEP
jgi:hypothetical protein